MQVIETWSKGFQVGVDARTVFAREVLVREDTALLWLPTQDSVVDAMQHELKRGERIEAYVVYVGAEGDRGSSIDWVLLINDFRAVSSAPPPSQRELNGYLIGQHEKAIAAGSRRSFRSIRRRMVGCTARICSTVYITRICRSSSRTIVPTTRFRCRWREIPDADAPVPRHQAR